MSSLQIQIGSDVAPAIAGIKQVQQSVSKLGDSLETLKAKALAKQEFIRTEKNVSNISRLNKEIQSLELEIKRVQNIGKAGFDEFGNSVEASSDKMIQGFNTAFQSIRKIAYILPGIGIAGIFSLAFDQIQEFLKSIVHVEKGLTDIQKATHEFALEIDFLNERIKNLSGFGDFENKLALLRSQIKFGGGTGTDIFGLRLQIESAQKSKEELKTLTEDLTEQIASTRSNLRFLGERDNNKQLLELLDIFAGAEQNIKEGDFKDFSELQKAQLNTLIEQRKSYNDASDALERKRQEIQEKVLQIDLIRAEETRKKEKEAGEGRLRDLEKLIARANEITARFGGIFGDPIDKLFDSFNTQVSKAATIVDNFLKGNILLSKGLHDVLGFNNQDLTISIPTLVLDPQKIKLSQKRIEELLENGGTFTRFEPVIQVRTIPLQNTELTPQQKALEFGRQLLDQSRETARLISSTLTGAFDGFFDSLTRGENVIKGFFNGLKQAIIGVIKELIQAAIRAFVFKTILKGAGLLGSPLGAALNIGSIAGLASGGLVSGPTLAVVGEGQGTSLSNPEVIAPLDTLRGMIGGLASQNVSVQVSGVVRGNDLALILDRNTRYQGRNT